MSIENQPDAPPFEVNWLPRVSNNGHHPEKITDEGETPEHLTQKFVPGGAFILDAPEQIPCLWGVDQEIAWAEGEALIINGPSGVGKTTLTAQLVRGRLGLQDTVLGWPVTPGKKRVLYLAMDRPRQIARANRRLYDETERVVMDDRLIFHQGPPPQDLAKHTHILCAMAEAADADTIVVDSLKDAALKLTDDETGGGYNRARQKALVEGIEVLELHHQRKSGATNAKPNHLDDVYGSTWITAGAGSVLLLWGAPGDTIIEVTHLKQPAESVGPLRIYHDHDTGQSTIWNPMDVIALAIANKGRLTPRLAAIAMFERDNPDRNEIERARRKLDAVVRTGKLHCSPGTKGGAESTYAYVDQRVTEHTESPRSWLPDP